MTKFTGTDKKKKSYIGTLYILDKVFYIEDFKGKHEVLKDTVKEIQIGGK